MPSSQLIALEKHLSDFEANFIVRRGDYALYTPQDHMNAIAYRLLASAAIESYVESRCEAIARQGADRISKGLDTATGRSLIMWFLTSRKNWRSQALLHPADPFGYLNQIDEIVRAYVSHVRSSHGISGSDLQNLVYALGLREAQLQTVLVESLNVLADLRNPASHSYENRGKSMTEPAAEADSITRILVELRKLDDDLQLVCDSFPVEHMV